MQGILAHSVHQFYYYVTHGWLSQWIVYPSMWVIAIFFLMVRQYVWLGAVLISPKYQMNFSSCEFTLIFPWSFSNVIKLYMKCIFHSPHSKITISVSLAQSLERERWALRSCVYIHRSNTLLYFFLWVTYIPATTLSTIFFLLNSEFLLKMWCWLQ